MGPIPNISNNTNPLKCFIKSIDCKYNSKIDIINRKLDDYYDAISETLINRNNFIFIILIRLFVYRAIAILMTQRKIYLLIETVVI